MRVLFFIFMAVSIFAEINFTDPTAVTGDEIPNLSKNEKSANTPQVTVSSTGKHVYAIWHRNYIVQTARSENFGVVWEDPTTVTGDGGIPNLSDDGQNAENSQITTDSTGKYVYAIWQLNNGVYTTIQTARSENFGVVWKNPTAVTGDGGIPNLSDDDRNAENSQITTDSTGTYVYAIWQRTNTTGHRIIQTVKSIDSGNTWETPIIVTGDGTPNLSKDGGHAFFPQITTDSTGKFVYAIWHRYNGLHYIVQMARSKDHGITWTNPTTVTGSATPNLSTDGKNARSQQIITNSTGQYIYAIWRRNDGSDEIIQTAFSSDYGVTWKNPTTVTGDGGVPNLSNSGESADWPQITTNSTGQYVYAIWYRDNGPEYIIQTAISSDYGVTWKNPTTVTGDGTPNLSKDGERARDPQITTDSTGKFVYAIWHRNNGSDNIIQTAISSDFGVTWKNPTTVTGDGGVPNLSDDNRSASASQIATDSTGKYIYTIWGRSDDLFNTIIQSVNGINTIAELTQVFGSQAKIVFPFEIDLTNNLSWNDLSGAVSYKVYRNRELTDLVTTIPSHTLKFVEHQIKSDTTTTYYVTWTDVTGDESAATEVTLP